MAHTVFIILEGGSIQKQFKSNQDPAAARQDDKERVRIKSE